MPSLVHSRLDYGNATLAGLPSHFMQRLQSVMNAAARTIYLTSRYDHISPLLNQLHWLKARERIDFKLAVLVFKCLNGTAPAYLADELSHPSDFVNRRRLRSASSSRLIVRRTRLSTYGDRVFSVAGLVSGTVFRIMSLLHLQSVFSKAVSRHFYSLVLFLIFLTLCKVPGQCH